MITLFGAFEVPGLKPQKLTYALVSQAEFGNINSCEGRRLSDFVLGNHLSVAVAMALEGELDADKILRMLIIEDSVDDAEHLISVLRNAGIAVRP